MPFITLDSRLDIGPLTGALASMIVLHGSGQLVADVPLEGDVLVANFPRGADDEGVPIV